MFFLILLTILFSHQLIWNMEGGAAAPPFVFDQSAVQTKSRALFSDIRERLRQLAPSFVDRKPVYPAGYHIELAVFTQTLKEAIALNHFLLNDPDKWLHAEKPDFAQLTRGKDIGFQQREIISPGIKMVCQGDMHGDAHSFINLIEYFQEKGWIERDSLRIKNPNAYFLSFGDLTDRGCFGAYVLLLWSIFKLCNPDQVFMVRGNHEDLNINNQYGLKKELEHLFGEAYEEVYPLLHSYYNSLPFVLYMGVLDSNESRRLSCVRFNHGAISMGFFPNELLGAERGKKYSWVKEIDMATWNMRIKQTINTEYPGYEQDQKVLAKLVSTRSLTVPLNSIVELHDVWGDIVIFRDENQDLRVARRGTFNLPAVGYETTKAFLEACGMHYGSEDEFEGEVFAIFRAHQHTSETLPLIRNNPRDPHNPGVLRSWLEEDDPRAAKNTYKKIQRNMVYTFNVCPNTLYGSGDNTNRVGVIVFKQPLKESLVKIHTIPNKILTAVVADTAST
jgi:hypothetical protein